MPYSRDALRRWFGAICLAIAAGMLVLGQTVLKARLQQRAFIYYWLTCTVFTGLTLIVALLDMRAVRRRSQEEQKDLIQEVLRGMPGTEDKKNGKSRGK